MTSFVCAKPLTSEAEYIYIVGKDDTKISSGENALREAKKLALGYILEQQIKFDLQITEELLESEIETICNEMADIKILSQNWSNRAYHIKIKLSLKTDSLKTVAQRFIKAAEYRGLTDRNDLTVMMERSEVLKKSIIDFKENEGLVVTPQKELSVEMILIDGGVFFMGSENGAEDEMPVHDVILSPFWMSKYEITQRTLSSVMEKNPSPKIKDFLLEVADTSDYPVHNISWKEAVLFCNRLSIKDRLEPVYIIEEGNVICDFSKSGYRLPTEAEWEYAAKGGQMSNGYKFSGSDDIQRSTSWNEYGDVKKGGAYLPNELGLYDMSGNVSEWCWDWYDESYYDISELENPAGPKKGKEHVKRGRSMERSPNKPVEEFFFLSHRGVVSSTVHISYMKKFPKLVGLRIVRTAQVSAE